MCLFIIKCMKYFNILFIIITIFFINLNPISSYPKYIKIALLDNYNIPFSLHNSFTYFLQVSLQDNKIGVNETIFEHLQQQSELFYYKIFYDESCYITSVSNKQYKFNLHFKDCGNVFGLGRYSIQNNQYSILHSLYEQKIIDKEIFSLELSSNKQEQFLYLGEYPYDIKHFSSINTFEVNQQTNYLYNNSWSIRLDKLESNGNILSNPKKSLIFSLSEDNTLVTQDIFIWISKYVFGPFVQDKRCKIEQIYSWDYILCDRDVYQLLPKLNFIQGNSIFEYTIRNDSRGRVDIAYNPILDDDNDILYLRRNGFINKIISFNSESQTITIYSNYNIEDTYEKQKLYITISDLIIVFGIINCLICCIVKYIVFIFIDCKRHG